MLLVVGVSVGVTYQRAPPVNAVIVHLLRDPPRAALYKLLQAESLPRLLAEYGAMVSHHHALHDLAFPISLQRLQTYISAEVSEDALKVELSVTMAVVDDVNGCQTLGRVATNDGNSVLLPHGGVACQKWRPQ